MLNFLGQEAENRAFIYNIFSSIDAACLHDLARHFKTDTTETVAFLFGIYHVFDIIDTV
jgi:hypothetical protein